ncbi:MAG TPA: 3-oxoacyl-ACP reductase FabG [Steroidobacteraceae bacterium]|nr:3-oxoacyl-ACP reductase FabG [Steroidobacteraceae bacterium]
MTANNEVALVTGASRGIGQAIAAALAGTGAAVIGTATTAEGAAAISAWFTERGLNGRGAVYNAADPDGAAKLVADLESREGLPTILVNNAGVTRDGLMLRMKDEDWNQVIDINLSGVFRLTKLCLKRMLKERRGRIINITSVIGAIGNPGQANYAAAKAGLIGFTRSLARELGSRNITVNAVAPGFIETDMTRALPEQQRAAYLAQIPLGRFGSGEEVANTVIFLAGNQAAYLTGQTLHLNGGMYMG